MSFRWLLGGAMLAVVACSAMPLPAIAQMAKPPALNSGAVEWGLAGALVSRGSTGATLATRIGGLWAPWQDSAPGGLVGLELATVYSHVRELDTVDLLASASWSQPVGNQAFVPFVALSGGIRQEWLGSFHESRVPVGGGFGFRALTGHRAAFRAEYLYLHVLDDPVGDRDEHQVLLGLSIFFRNN